MSQDKVHVFLPARATGKCAEVGREFSTGCRSAHLVAAAAVIGQKLPRDPSALHCSLAYLICKVKRPDEWPLC